MGTDENAAAREETVICQRGDGEIVLAFKREVALADQQPYRADRIALLVDTLPRARCGILGARIADRSGKVAFAAFSLVIVLLQGVEAESSRIGAHEYASRSG